VYLKIIIPALLAILSLKVTAQEKDTLSGDYQGLNFQDFATRVEAELGVRFFYRDDWVKDLKVGNYPDCHTLSCLLDHLFGGTSLYYMREKSGNIIITKYFAIKVNPVEKDSNFLPSGEESGAKSSQPQDNGAYTVIGNPSEVRKPGNAIISGYITNEDTKESLPGVTVFVKRLATGTLSNEYGFYSLSLPRGIHLVQFSSIG
jgi:hypothetical protein